MRLYVPFPFGIKLNFENLITFDRRGQSRCGYVQAMMFRRVVVVVAFVAALIGFSACDEQTNAASTTEAKMPQVTCLALDKAKDALKDVDLQGKDVKVEDRKEHRSSWVDSNWIVVDQQPAADTELTAETKAVLGVVKKGERECSNTTTTSTTSVSSTTTPPTTTAETTPVTAAIAPATTATPTVPATSPPTTTVTTQKKIATTSPPTTASSPSSGGTVHSGAFCSSEGATGYTEKGVLMRCSYKTGDERLRWRAV
jgi:uncharacterized protein (UPF0333 family)